MYGYPINRIRDEDIRQLASWIVDKGLDDTWKERNVNISLMILRVANIDSVKLRRIGLVIVGTGARFSKVLVQSQVLDMVKKYVNGEVGEEVLREARREARRIRESYMLFRGDKWGYTREERIDRLVAQALEDLTYEEFTGESLGAVYKLMKEAKEASLYSGGEDRRRHLMYLWRSEIEKTIHKEVTLDEVIMSMIESLPEDED